MNKLILKLLPIEKIKPDRRQEQGSNGTGSILGDVRRVTTKRGGDGLDGYEIEYTDGTRIILVFEGPEMTQVMSGARVAISPSNKR